MIRAAFSSVANLAVVPMQDWLGLGSRARMNTPSTLGGDNWRWRMAADAATAELAERIHATTKLYGRLSIINQERGKKQ
jgi:4-alpha-glucanotransferase